MTGSTAADLLVECLEAEGVAYVFGIPGLATGSYHGSGIQLGRRSDFYFSRHGSTSLLEPTE